MLQSLDREANRTVTENGASTHITSGSECLDLFATIGAMRAASKNEIEKRFLRAFTENRDMAMKLLFFARDVRGGLGERRVFRVLLRWLALHEPQSARKNLAFVAEYGRYDDLLVLMDTPLEKEMLDLLQAQLQIDLAALARGEQVSLLAKWLPSVNASCKQTVLCAKRIAKHFGLNDAAYRRALVSLRARIQLIENALRERDYTFDYAKQPSRAMYKYRKAFIRNDGERYAAYLDRVNAGEETLHADTLAPYELVEPYLNGYNTGNSFMRAVSPEEKAVLNATWASLPVFETNENVLAVIDTSGSMYCDARPLPASVALSLGLYFAEHNTGLYKDHFIEFSSRPRLIKIKGKTFADRLRYVASFCEVANTNLEAVFSLVLDSAVKNRVPQEELPRKLIIVSDMEFDCCVDNARATVFEQAKKSFAAHGYRLPDIVFWNVASRHTQQPVTMNEQGVALVSGCTPRLYTTVASGVLDPYAFMLEVIEDPRYADIIA